MIFKEFGDRSKDVIILLHGGGLSWWNYKDEIKLLQNEFHLIIPILDGHSESDKEFTTIEDNAREIIDFINQEFNGHVVFIGGLSLGGQVLLEILSKKKDICDYAIIESALVIPMKTTYKMIKPTFKMCYSLISKKWFSKMQFNSLKMKKDLFEDYYKDTCNISKESLIAFMKSNANYEIKETLRDTLAKVLILVGAKERNIMKKSANMIQQQINNSEIEILDKYYHGDISINHAEQYVEKINRLIKKK